MFIYVLLNMLSKINASAAQNNKETIQAHAFLRKDIIRKIVKTKIGRGNQERRQNKRARKRKITVPRNPRLRYNPKEDHSSPIDVRNG